MRIVLAAFFYLFALSITAKVVAQSDFSPQEQASLINSGILGTNQVVFNEGRSAGDTISCSIVFTATFQDFASNEGRLHIANGNFTVFGQGDLPLVSMKLGISRLTRELASFVNPEFAYFESSFGSSAKMNQDSGVSDPGYKVFIYLPDDPLFVEMFDSLLSSQKLKLYFNRHEDGLDQAIEIETDVVDISVDPATSEFTRIRSDSAMGKFAVCALGVLSKMVDSSTP
jgi:hypothetical protein